MKLEELRKKLYKRKPISKERPVPPVFHPEAPREELFHPRGPKKERPWETMGIIRKKPFIFSRKQLLLGGLILLVLVFLAATAMLYFLQRPVFRRIDVKIEIKAPGGIRSGEKVSFEIDYKNGTEVVLKDAELIFYYPEDSFPLDGPQEGALISKIPLGNLFPGKEGKRKFEARIIGEQGESKSAKAKIVYRPGNISSRFENIASHNILIISVPLILNLYVPQQAVADEEVTYRIEYINTSEAVFESFGIQMEYPLGFRFYSSSPPPSEGDNIWDTGELKEKGEGEVVVRGTLSGSEGEIKTLRVSAGVWEEGRFIQYIEASSPTRITASPLLISQGIEGAGDFVAGLGDRLSYRIRYENNFDENIRELTLVARLEGEMFDSAKIEVENKGIFDPATRTITWSKKEVSQLGLLKPGDKGEVGFNIKVREEFPIDSFDDKNFLLKVFAQIESSQAPPSLGGKKLRASSESQVKINTQLTLRAKGFYHDATSGITNSGPIPPKAGKPTTYTIHWQMSNPANDADNVVIEGVLGPDVEWTGKVKSNYGDSPPSYNELTGKVVWQVGKVPATTGIVLPTYEAVFQVRITPSLDQVGKLVRLIGESKVSGRDTFTGVDLKDDDLPIYTDLPDDPYVGKDGGIVVE